MFVRFQRQPLVVAAALIALATACTTSSPVQTSTTTKQPTTTEFQQASATISSTSTTTAPPTRTTAPIEIDYVAYVSNALDFAETNYYWTDRVDWDSIRTQALTEVKGDPTAQGAYTAIEEALKSVVGDRHDPHTGFLTPKQAAAFPSPDQPRPSFPPRGERLDNNIGYLTLPSVVLGDDQYPTYATQIRHLMETIESKGPACGWIVSLRNNTGGASQPGWLGLGPLIGQGAFMRFIGHTNTVEVSYQNEHIFEEDTAMPKRPGIDNPVAYETTNHYMPQHPDAPVAILTSGQTASAAEAILVAFLGRPDTRTFGEPTFGAPTSPALMAMPDGAHLSVTQYLDQDRLGNTYQDSIQPDQYMLNVSTGDVDPVRDAAADWLRQTDSCRQR